MWTTGHLKPAEFTDLLEGIPLGRKRKEHFAQCDRCRTVAEQIGPCFEEIDGAADCPVEVNPDWNALRSSVRDSLLTRAVQRSASASRWHGLALLPSAAWSVPLVLVVSLFGLGVLWHFANPHFLETASMTEVPTSAVGANEPGLNLFLDDPAALETEALAWSDSEIFIALNQLEDTEAEAFLDLIADAFAGDDGV